MDEKFDRIAELRKAAARVTEERRIARQAAPVPAPTPFPVELFLPLTDFLALPLPPREPIIEGLILQQSIVQLFGWRGDMKTWTALDMGVAIASGGQFLCWRVPQPRRVLYLDGEMAARDLQDRVRSMTGGKAEGLMIMASELFLRQLAQGLALDRPEHQQRLLLTLKALAEAGRGPEVLIFDNLSAFTPGAEESDNEVTATVNAFFTGLRHAGYTVIFVHHAGKSGDQRGDSRREDPLDLVMKVTRSTQRSDWVVLTFGKVRGVVVEPQEVTMALQMDTTGQLRLAQVTSAVRPPRADEVEQNLHILRYIDDNNGNLERKDIGEQFQIGKSAANEQVARLIKKGYLSGERGLKLKTTEKGRRALDDAFPDRGEM